MQRPSSRTHHPHHPRRLLAIAAITFLTVATACGDDDDADTAASEAPATDAPAASEAPAAAEPAATDEPAGTSATGSTPAGGSTIAVADSDLGSILVDGAGRTLYMFVPDAQGPSVCTEGCLEAWPAIAGPATAGDGVDAELLGTATRTDDGSEQATCNGWPLYLFASDVSPGDVTGQGVGDNWYVLDATCTPVGMP